MNVDEAIRMLTLWKEQGHGGMRLMFVDPDSWHHYDVVSMTPERTYKGDALVLNADD